MKERLWTDKEIKAAMTIQANYRGHQSRVAVAELRLERAKKMAELAELELKEASAVRIQAGFRGHK